MGDGVGKGVVLGGVVGVKIGVGAGEAVEVDDGVGVGVGRGLSDSSQPNRKNPTRRREAARKRLVRFRPILMVSRYLTNPRHSDFTLSGRYWGYFHPVALYKLAPVHVKMARIVPRHAVAPTANISRRTATIFFSLSGSRDSEANPVPWLCGINRELMSPPSERKSKWFMGGSSCNKASSFAYEFDGNRVRIFDETSAKGPRAHGTAKICLAGV